VLLRFRCDSAEHVNTFQNNPCNHARWSTVHTTRHVFRTISPLSSCWHTHIDDRHVSLANHVSTHFLIHLSAHLCHHHHSHHPSLRDSFTPSQNLPFQQILPTLILLLPWTAFMIMGPNRTYHASRFIFSLFFSLIFCLFRVVDSAGYTSAFYCTLNTQYRIVS